MPRTTAWKRSQDVALASSNERAIKINRSVASKGTESEEVALLKPRNRHIHNQFLEMVKSRNDPGKDGKDNERSNELKNCTNDDSVNKPRVDSKSSIEVGTKETVRSTHVVNSLSQGNAERKQNKKKSNQKKNQESKRRPVPSAYKGEVKQTSIEPFPPADDLPSANDLPLGDLGCAQTPESNGSRLLIPSSVIKYRKKASDSCMKNVCFVPETEENWGPAPPNQHKMISSLKKNFDAPTMQLLASAGGGGLTCDADLLMGRPSIS